MFDVEPLMVVRPKCGSPRPPRSADQVVEKTGAGWQQPYRIFFNHLIIDHHRNSIFTDWTSEFPQSSHHYHTNAAAKDRTGGHEAKSSNAYMSGLSLRQEGHRESKVTRDEGHT